MLPFIISVTLSILLLILSCILHLAGKMRLTLPVLYILAVSTLFNHFATEYQMLTIGILIALMAFSIISWVRSLWDYIVERRYYQAIAKDISWQVHRAHDRGLDNVEFYIDPEGNLRYQDTDEIIT